MIQIETRILMSTYKSLNTKISFFKKWEQVILRQLEETKTAGLEGNETSPILPAEALETLKKAGKEREPALFVDISLCEIPVKEAYTSLLEILDLFSEVLSILEKELQEENQRRKERGNDFFCFLNEHREREKKIVDSKE